MKTGERIVPMRMSGPAAAVLVLWFLSAGMSGLWLWLDRQPPAWDDSWYLSGSLVVYDALRAEGISGMVRAFFSVLGFKAPLITGLPAPFYLVLGRDWHVAYLVNLVAMLVLFATVYGIGKKCGNAWAGAIAVTIVATMPLLYGLSRWFLVEYTLTAMVAVAIWLLLLSPDLQRRGLCLGLGVLLGFGLLLKVSFPLFLALPLAIALARCGRKPAAVVEIAVPCLVIALPWYSVHWRAVFENAVAAGFGETSTAAQGTGAIFSWHTIGGYLALVARHGVTWFYAGLFAATVIAVLLRRERPVWTVWKDLMPWLAPAMVFLFAGNKDIRYAAPLYPVLAITLAVALDRVATAHTWLLIPLAAIPVTSMWATSFHWPYAGEPHVYARRYQPALWPQTEIVNAIAGRAPVTSSPRKPLVLVGTDRAAFNANNLELAIRQLQLPLAVETTAYMRDRHAVLRAADSASFVVFKEGGEPESGHFNTHWRELAGYVRNSPDSEEIYTSGPMPDGGIAHVFQIRRTSPPSLPPFRADFGGMVQLYGLSVAQTADALEVKYGWRTVKRVDREYWCFTHIVDESGKIVGFLDHRILDGAPVITEWKPGGSATESLRFALPEGKPQLRVRIGLYHVPSGQRLPVATTEKNVSIIQDGTALELAP